jgi:chemotaxis protein CheD
MQVKSVGVADCVISDDPDASLVTYALGSCIAVAIHDGVAGVGGLLHFMLPDSSIGRSKAAQNPWMFADTGIPLLFRRAYDLGAARSRLIVYSAGGAQVCDDRGIFNVGKRNCDALRQIFQRAGIQLRGEVLGGTASRSVRLEIASGTCWLRESESACAGIGEPDGSGKGVSEWRTLP